MAALQRRFDAAAGRGGVAVVRTRPRSGRYARILIAVVLYALYFNAIGMARSAVEQGVASHLWWAPLALAVLLVGVLVAQRRTGV
ncbi:MAG: hypothetical protein R3E84_16170 [Pseudomonadales bacterium]